ncbi:ABC transporter ATP-binding protein [Acetobacterium bakii]|uniref:Iron ABC transporter ATP-binding protein n=1 Tax=Acetobacterium bakii TaxID=52689 RepID=A0A0L6TXY3_9FIRM|nr:ABC transporter ATP-binding protein [Acetobacterium bakii]KNZ41113.1 iron ABC transporter ATP-binding protein [Acetobacterium bakii]
MYFQTDNLSVGYCGKALIKNINIGVEKGKILCLLGPNGSGKSTILKSISRHLKKIAGTVFIAKEDMNNLNSVEVAKRLSVVLTEKVAPELMTCEEVVATGRYPYTNHFGKLTDEDHRIIEESMAAVSVLDLMDNEFSHLSDGQKQRVLLARAICQQPEIIILDEPTSYLDIRHKIELLGILRKMAVNQKVTVILSLHEVDLAAKLADTIILVKDNSVYGSGCPEDVLSDTVIKKLYGIEAGSFNMLMGSVELPKTCQTEPKVFVFGGDGYGTRCYRALHKRGISFCTGVLYHNDVDYQVAMSLARQTIFEKSFRPISDVIYEQACKAMLNCKVIIDTGFDLDGVTNRNRQLLELAYNTNKPILSLRKQPQKTKANIQYFNDIGSMISCEKLMLESGEKISISMCS